MNVTQVTPPLTERSAVDDEDLVRRVEKIENGGFHGRRTGPREQGDGTLSLKSVTQTIEQFVSELGKLLSSIIRRLFLTDGEYVFFNWNRSRGE